MSETVKGINIKLGLDGKDLDNELKEIKSELKGQEKDLKAINNNLKYDTNNLSLWKDKQDKLNSILTDTKKKLQNQNEQLEKAKEAVKIGAMSQKEFDQLQRNVQYSEAEIAKLNDELKKTKEKINDLGNAKWDKIASIGSTLTKSVTAPIMGAVAALSALATKTAITADEIGDTAAKIGLSAEQLQEWNHVANICGTETASLQKGFVKVNAILGDIATGNGDKVSESLSAIGLSVEDLEGLNADQAFELIRKSLAKIKDESLRVGLANEFFGDKLGSELLPMLSSEEQAIKDLRQECRDLGIITNEQAAQADNFTNNIARTKQSLSSLAMDITSLVLPVLEMLLGIIREKIIPTIKSWLEKWNNMSDGTKKMILVLIGLAAAIGPVMTVIGKVMPILKGLKMLLHATGEGGIFAGTGINFATLGIGALIAILAMALMQSETFKELLMKIGETFMRLLQPIMDIVQVLLDALMPIFEVIINLVVRIIDLLMPLIEALLAPLLGQFEMLAGFLELIAPLIEIVAQVISAILLPILELLFKILEPILWLLEKIINAVSKVFGKVGDFFGKIGKGLGDFGNWLGGTLGITNNKKSTTTNNNSQNTTNNVTVNTSSSEFDIDSINKALGGNYL